MKTIELKTTQNVAIQYELASARDRGIAFILDTIFKIIAWVVLGMLILTSVKDDDVLSFLFAFILIPTITFYTLFFEVVWNGQTPGKRIMKLRVINLAGKQMTFFDYMLRWSFRIIDIYMTIGVFAVLGIVSTKFGQRFGDTLANCTVIKLGDLNKVSLEEIMRIDSKMSYVPVYPQIRNFREEDIVLLKQALDRYNKHNNEGHAESIKTMTEIFAQKLELESVPLDRVSFLRTLLKDYIVLTR
ncbi:MAG: RDD family protein [Flavobacteriales bacterium]